MLCFQSCFFFLLSSPLQFFLSVEIIAFFTLRPLLLPPSHLHSTDMERDSVPGYRKVIVERVVRNVKF